VRLLLLAFALAACHPELQTYEACDASVSWLHDNGFPTTGGFDLDNWEFVDCENLSWAGQPHHPVVDVLANYYDQELQWVHLELCTCTLSYEAPFWETDYCF
jgi:hypothetical protein